MIALARIAEAVRVIVGVPSYRLYGEHMAAHHPEREPMDERAFHHARQKARYEGGAGRCC